MMLAHVRGRLGREDAQLVVRLLGAGRPETVRRLEQQLVDHGLDPLLDEPELLAALVHRRPASHASLPLFCYVVVRHALLRLGARDRGLADYVASLLLHFGLRQRAYQLAEHDDQLYHTLTQIAGEIESADAHRAFLARAHLGNYALWLSGLFPEYIAHRHTRRGGPDLQYYEAMGRRGFQLAAGHRLAAQHGLAPLFGAAAEAFPQLRQALNGLSDTLLFPHVHTPERLMRQVRDAFLTGNSLS
ncbi:MAG: hypothetical protein MUD17_01315 [Gemmatimonadaceae bacterium]|jgi:hypothetical protein|nr:hypothetical protein [Gemmatimonadaceae bacterium]